MAFAWLVMRAAWRPTRVRYKDRVIQLERGQLAVSVRDMASAMERDKAWVERLLKRLKRETMIETDHETGVNVITIRNYDKFQPSKDAAETVEEAPNETRHETVARQSRDTEQEREIREEKKEEYSEAKASGTVVPHPAMDFCKAVFDSGRAILTQSGMNDRQAGSLIGKWRKDLDDATIMILLRQAEVDAVGDPAAWLTAAVATRSGKRTAETRASYVSDGGHVYRSHDPADVMREAEKRADWSTFYQAKSDLEARRVQA